MKKIIGNILAALLVVCIGCSDDDNTLPTIKPEKTGTVTVGDTATYGWARYDGLDWMTSNFREGQPYYEQTTENEWGNTESYIYKCEDLTPEEWEIYGNLYTYAQAKAYAPEGWRLPTDEDWKRLERAMGMSASAADATGFRGTVEGALLQQDATGTGMALCFGGYAIVKGRPAWLTFQHWREFGYYWTSTVAEKENNAAFPDIYYRKISYRSSQIERNETREVDSNYETNHPKHMSVRYVRDAVD